MRDAEEVSEMDKKQMKYPEQNLVSTGGGSKVGYRTYSSEATAKECSEIAEHNAEIQEAKGYDFGYQCPGEVYKTDNGWVVTIP